MRVREDLPKFLESRGLVGVGVEVGVYQAEFATHILKNWKGEKLYLVDAWRYFEGIEDINNKDPNTQLDNFAHTFMNVYEFDKKAVIIRDLSVEAAKLFKDGSLDFVYIDASHDHVNVYNDMVAWYPKIKKSGILCGHDYLDGLVIFLAKPLEQTPENERGHVSVKSGVDKFAKEHELVVNKTEEPVLPSWWIEV